MNNGENSIEQLPATFASKNLRKMMSWLEIIVIIPGDIEDLLIIPVI